MPFLKFKNQLFLYQGGFDNSALPSNISVMLVLLNLCIDDAIQNGIKKIHLLSGLTKFKSTFTKKNLKTKKIVIGKGYKIYIYVLHLKFKAAIKRCAKFIIPSKKWNDLKKNFKGVY